MLKWSNPYHVLPAVLVVLWTANLSSAESTRLSGVKKASSTSELRLGPVDARHPSASKPQPRVEEDVAVTAGVRASLDPAARIDARILVISADGSEADLPAITQALSFQGTPYTLWNARQHVNGLTAAVLANGSHAFYQGVILATGNLAYYDRRLGRWTSALSSTEWTNLANFETTFGIRQVTWYTSPTADYGFGAVTTQDTSVTPLDATLTDAGRQVYGYLNAATPVRIQNAYCYLAAPAAGTTPLLTDAAGHAIALVKAYPDGRENLAFTCDGAPWLMHSITTAYGSLNWVSRGLFVGYRRVYMAPQVDDYFIEDDLYTGGVYRMNATDLQVALNWQNAFRATPVGASFRYEIAFNGVGSEPDYWPNDTLVSATRNVQGQLKWVSHTYTHLELDSTTYAETYQELAQNLDVARSMGFTLFSADSLVPPGITGLSNPDALKAEQDIGIRFLVSDTSQTGQNNPSPNVGIINATNPALFEIPRHPTNLYYNVATPSQWRAEYNAIYRSYWKRDLSYPEILDKESDFLAQYMLQGDMDPWMFHQPNLSAYDGTHSLLSDLLDAALAKYKARYTLPVVSPTMGELGREMLNRTRLPSAGVTVTYGNGSITLTAQQAVTVPVTGLHTADAQLYGGQYTAFVPLAAGQSVTLPLQ